MNDEGTVTGYDDYGVSHPLRDYPFGHDHVEDPAPDGAGRSNNTANPGDLYKYSGKELDQEVMAGGNLDWCYFGRVGRRISLPTDARYYDPEIARWHVVDPLTNKSPSLSPYVYCSNSPLNRIDPDGMADFKHSKRLNEVGIQAVYMEKHFADFSIDFENDWELIVDATYCNIGTQFILNEGGDHTLDNMMANDMYNYLNENAIPITWEEAVEYAYEGVTTFMAVPSPEGSSHGHVVVVAPEEMVYSGSWDIEVPIVYQIGVVNGKMAASRAFNSNNKPKGAFILPKDKKSADERKNNPWWPIILESMLKVNRQLENIPEPKPLPEINNVK